MNEYEITDPKSGRTIVLSGDTPPNEEDISSALSTMEDNFDLNIEDVVQKHADNPENIKSIDDRIEQRGTAFLKDRIDNWKNSSGVISPVIKALGVVSAPQERAEAAFANAFLAMQKGKFGDIVQEFKDGASGKKMGEIGDALRNSGIPILNSETFFRISKKLEEEF
jgi:hypothetical protein